MDILFIHRVLKSIYHYCPEIDENVALFIAAQFALESEFGRSSIAKDNCNYCGMKIPSSRFTSTVKMSYNLHPSFMSYANLDECVLDYFYRCAWFQFSFNHFQNVDDFKRVLRNSGYCPEKDYISRIEKIYNQFINLKLSQNEQNY